MARVAVQEDGKPAEGLALPGILASLRPRRGWGDRLFHGLTRAAALTLLAVVLAMVAVMTRAALPSLRAFGWRFLVTSTWDPVTEHFGALPLIYGTLGFFAPRLGDRRAPRHWRRHLPGGAGPPVDSLAHRVPGGAAGRRAQRRLRSLGHLRAGPAAAELGRAGPGQDPRIPTALPGPALRLRHAGGRPRPGHHDPADHHLGEPGGAAGGAQHPAGGALALGATRWETTRLAVLRYGKSGIIGAILLGLGRALGETMAVTMVIGNRPEIAASLFAPGYTMASVIANEFTEATGDLYLSALTEIGLILFAVTVLLNVLARLLVWRVGGPAREVRGTERREATRRRSRHGRARGAGGHSRGPPPGPDLRVPPGPGGLGADSGPSSRSCRSRWGSRAAAWPTPSWAADPRGPGLPARPAGGNPGGIYLAESRDPRLPWVVRFWPTC